MFRFLIRVAGLWLVAGAMVALVVDATKTIATSTVTTTPLGATWNSLGAESLATTRSFIQEQVEVYVGAWVWDPTIQWVLAAPTWLALGSLGFVLMYVGGRGRALVQYI